MIFDFLKHQKKPRPIFGGLCTDMHCHLLPSVDDGSKAVQESVECLRVMSQVGYKRVYLTPHFQYPRFQNKAEDILRRYDEFKTAVAAEGLNIELAGIGGEYRLDPGFEKRIEGAKLLTVGQPSDISKGYMLVELPLHQRTEGYMDMIELVQKKGYTVIMAHPERYPYINTGSMEFEDLKDMGVLLQVNVLSLDGFYGEIPLRRAWDLYERGWVELLGTDTHNIFYAQALVHASHNRKIQKIIEKDNFLNIDL